MKRWLIEYLLKFDYLADGIRVRLFVAAAVLQVFLAPMWDLYLPYKRIAARMEPSCTKPKLREMKRSRDVHRSANWSWLKPW